MPHYEKLTLKEVLAFAYQTPGMRAYFPVEHELEKLPREWICNVVYTKLGADFEAWVKERIDARNKEAMQKADGEISVDPRIAAAFHASTHVSSKYFAAARLPSYF